MSAAIRRGRLVARFQAGSKSIASRCPSRREAETLVVLCGDFLPINAACKTATYISTLYIRI
jgi:hypothetical protein